MPAALLPCLFAAQPATTWDKLKGIPTDTWLNLAICVLAVVIVIRAWRALKKINDFVPYIFAVLAASGILFFWVYERKEPAFMTPVVEPLTHLLPTKGKQQEKLEAWRKSRRN